MQPIERLLSSGNDLQRHSRKLFVDGTTDPHRIDLLVFDDEHFLTHCKLPLTYNAIIYTTKALSCKTPTTRLQDCHPFTFIHERDCKVECVAVDDHDSIILR